MARRRDNAWVSPTLALVLLTGTCGVADCLAENPRYKGRTVAAKGEELKTKLGMNPAMAQATMAPPAGADIAPAN